MTSRSITSTQSSAPRRVLFLSDLGFQYGAGIAHARQLQSFLLAGWEAGAIAWEPGEVAFEALTTREVSSEFWLGTKRVRYIEPSATLKDDAVIAGLLSEVARFEPDLVLLGNLHAASWPLRLLPALKQLGCRVVAYLHDGHLFSGRCAYPGPCQLYLTGCNETCPTAHEYPALEPKLIAGQWQLRRDIFNGMDGVEVVANSDWMRDTFRSALPQCRSCETVYLAADAEVFKPGDKLAARRHWNLPLDKPVVLCAAVNFQDPRKGGNYLQEIIAAFGDSVTFAAFGHNANNIPNLTGLGYHTNPSALASIFQCADVFLGTAVEEAFGQTVMEAQLCGIPVVAFQAGGIVEIVRGEITGKLVRTGDVAGAVQALRSLLYAPEVLTPLSVWSRECSASRFALEVQVRQWGNYLDGTLQRGTGMNLPTISYPLNQYDHHKPHRPSWPVEGTFVNEEHTRIFELTSKLPGWQMQGDSEKLYEMGFHAGDVILEIGTFGGRSATVELRGALANSARTLKPQFYGIDISPESIARTRQTLAEQKLLDYCHLFEGTFDQFVTRWQIRPTMVFLDGDHRYEGAASDMRLLGSYLAPGTPVLVHDYSNPENDTGEIGVRRAAKEWVASGAVREIGCFGCSSLYLTQSTAAPA